MLNIFYNLKFDLKSMDWLCLSANPGAITFIDDNYYLRYQKKEDNIKFIYNKRQTKIDWFWFGRNENAIHILKDNLDKINLSCLSENPNAIHLLEANPDKIVWRWLSSNPKAIYLLEANSEKIDWFYLSSNPNAIQLLEANPDKIDWYMLSSNPNAIHILEDNPNKIIWYNLHENSNIRCVDLFNKNFNLKNINFQTIFQNYQSCIHFFQYNKYVLSIILEWDYQEIQKDFYASYGKELIEWIYNPIRYEKWGKTCWDLNGI